MTERKVILITGCSRGIGKVLSTAALLIGASLMTTIASAQRKNQVAGTRTMVSGKADPNGANRDLFGCLERLGSGHRCSP